MTDCEQVLRLCHALPAAELSHPFDADTAVFTVTGKMFALVDLAGEYGRVTVKADQGYAAALVNQHDRIIPGYHMNKRHWITVDLAVTDSPTTSDEMPTGLIEELLEESYDLVVAGLPVRLCPDSGTGGHGFRQTELPDEFPDSFAAVRNSVSPTNTTSNSEPYLGS